MNDERLSYVIDEIRDEVKISSVIGQYIDLKKVGSYEYEGLCEFHNDTSLGSFKVSDKKNVCKCFSCGAGKDVISYFAFKRNKNYVESAMELALSRKIISTSEYEEFSKIKFSDEKAKEIERIYIQKDKEKFENEIAPDKVLNNVYTAFFQESTLSSEHYRYLKEKRFLSDQDISEGGYFTFPNRTIMKSFEARLKRDYGYNPIILRNVPGFCRNKKTGLFTFTKNKGIGICIKNAAGLIVGIQIRRDGVNLKNKYIWFSSSRIERYEELSKRYDFGTKSDSRIDVVYPKKIRFKTIFITEGRFKAKCIADTFHCVAISVQGVGNWKNIKSEIEDIRKRIQIIDFNNIIIAYDADVAYNPQVFDQAIKMSKNLKKNLPGLGLYYAMWHVDYGKGIDDLIYSGHKDMLESINIDKFEVLYKNFIKQVESKYGNIVQNKVPKLVLKEHFNRFVINEKNFKKIIQYINSYNKSNLKEIV